MGCALGGRRVHPGKDGLYDGVVEFSEASVAVAVVLRHPDAD